MPAYFFYDIPTTIYINNTPLKLLINSYFNRLPTQAVKVFKMFYIHFHKFM